MSYEGILFEKKDGIATITLNSPDKLNAISIKMRESLMLVSDEISKDDSIKVAILTGAGRGFCAGADLGELMSMAPVEPTVFDRLQGTAAAGLFQSGKTGDCRH